MAMINRSPFAWKGAARPGYEITAKGKGTVEILLYDEISFWGISAQSFVGDLKRIEADKIVLRINSPGGSVFDGTAIYNALLAHPATVETHIDGLAASIASVIALAGDSVYMASNAFFMIHEPWSIVMGSAEDLRKEAELLDKISGTLIDTYAAKSGASVEDITAWMAAETWFTAEEAVEAGFADKVTSVKPKKSASALAAEFDLSVFNNTPAELILDTRGTDMSTERETERLLRDAGLSRSEAKTVIVKAAEAIAQRDAGDEGREETLALLTSLSSVIRPAAC